MIRSFADVRGGARRRADVCILGAGAAGSAAALALAEKGLRVVVVEQGQRYRPHEFVPKLSVATRRMYAEGGLRAMRGNVIIPLPGGEGVGGSTLINSAIAFRPPAAALDRFRRESGVDWFDADVLRPHVERAWRTVGVTRMHPLQVGRNNLVVQSGADRLGLAGSLMDRSAPGCVGCGVCHLGCPSGGKGSTDLNFVEDALAHGAEVLTSCRATRIVVRGGRAVGVEARAVDPETRAPHGRVVVEADKVLLAGSAIGTALALQRQSLGNRSGQVGRNLRVHPAVGAIALFDEEIRGWHGVPQGFYAVDPSAPDAILETFFHGPEAFYVLLPTIGLREVGLMKRVANLGGCGVMIRDDSAGVVRPGDDGRADIEYDVIEADRRKFLAGLRMTVRVLLAAGAREVHLQVHGAPIVRDTAELPGALPEDLPVENLWVYASHPMGTARIGRDPSRSVVRADGRLHDVDGLYVIDGSLFPSALGWNPSIAIMAIALHLCEGIARAG